MTAATTSPTRDLAKPRPARATRRVGYTIAMLVNAAMLYGVNVWPGWDAVPFLTQETEDVLTLVNISIMANLTVNAGLLLWDPPRMKALGDLVAIVVGLVAMVAIWRVFPLDLSSDWETMARILLVVGMLGSMIGILSALGKVVRPHHG